MDGIEYDSKLNKLIQLVERHAPREHVNATALDNLVLVRETRPHGNRVDIYGSGILCWLRGRKEGVIGSEPFELTDGSLLVACLPTPIETVLLETDANQPALGIGIEFDLMRIAELLVRLDSLVPLRVDGEIEERACFVQPLDERLLDALLRLVLTLDSAAETAVLAPMIIDEIYVHLLTNEHSAVLRHMLRHRGQVQLIAPAVRYIHQHLADNISVETLAATVNMSVSHFRRVFRRIMQMPPLQYAKSIKLDRAQTMLSQGMRVSDTARQVGYNSVAQFSREFRRQFGYAPSETETNHNL